MFRREIGRNDKYEVPYGVQHWKLRNAQVAKLFKKKSWSDKNIRVEERESERTIGVLQVTRVLAYRKAGARSVIAPCLGSLLYIKIVHRGRALRQSCVNVFVGILSEL